MCTCIAWKVRPQNDLYTVLGGTLNPTHSLAHSISELYAILEAVLFTGSMQQVS